MEGGGGGAKANKKRWWRASGRPLFLPVPLHEAGRQANPLARAKRREGEKGSASQARGFARRGENLRGGRISIIRLIGPDVSTCFNFSCRLNLKEYSKNTASLSWDALKGVSSPLARGQPVPIMNSQKMRRSLFPTPGALPQKLGGWVT